SRTAEPKIVGVTTGASQVELKLDNKIQQNIDFLNFKNHFSDYNQYICQTQFRIKNLNPPIFNVIVRKKAKVSDIMQYGQMFGFLNYNYSQKYIVVIKPFQIGEYSLFDFVIEDIPEKYYLMFINTIIFEDIFFNKSIIYSGNKVLNNVKYYDVNSFEEYKSLKQNIPLTRFEKIAISKEHFGKDIIEIQASGQPFYSERLIDFLLDCNISGLQIHYNGSTSIEFV